VIHGGPPAENHSAGNRKAEAGAGGGHDSVRRQPRDFAGGRCGAVVPSLRSRCDLVENPIGVADGHLVTPSDGRGLGIAVDKDRIARYRRA
jgi:hypothetical protein